MTMMLMMMEKSETENLNFYLVAAPPFPMS